MNFKPVTWPHGLGPSKDKAVEEHRRKLRASLPTDTHRKLWDKIFGYTPIEFKTKDENEITKK